MCSHTKFINNNSFCDSIARQKWNMCRLSPAPCHLNHKYFVSATCMQKQRPWQPKMMNQGQSRKKLSTPITTFITDHMLNPKFHWWRQIATTLREFHWRFWIIFLDAIAKVKKIIREAIAQNLKPVSLTKSFLALAMAFNLLLSNPT